MATAASLIPSLTFKSWLSNGQPNAGGSLQSYQAGTNTAIATWTDSTATVQNPNPITLNARGEANVYLLPNVGYKFIESDSLGNSIKTTDQVFNSQLLTLYGGVDTGSANAYVLNFAANFTSYTDGIVIEWIPSHTNSGPSVININSLGNINITNADGSALQANQVIANQPAQILVKGGAALLTTAAATVYGTFNAGWNGFSSNPSSLITYRKNGSQVSLVFSNTTGTSNTSIFQMTGLPAIITPNSFTQLNAPFSGLIDNGSNVAGGMAQIQTALNQINFYKDATQPVWTSSGTKGFAGPTVLNYTL